MSYVTEESLEQLRQEHAKELEELEKVYGGQITSALELKEAMEKASEEALKVNTQLTQQQTQAAVDQLKGDKEQARQSYLKEQSAAYGDFQQEAKAHGTRQEALTMAGLSQSGYAESSRVALYNLYQNRVASARSAYVAAVTEYDRAIAQAQTQNNALLAKIALETLEKQLQLSWENLVYVQELERELYDQKESKEKEHLEQYEAALEQLRRGQGSGAEKSDGKLLGWVARKGAQKFEDAYPKNIWEMIEMGRARQEQRKKSGN